MHAHNGAHVARQVPPAGSYSEVFRRVQPVSVNHEVTVVLIDSGRLAPISVVEELW